MVSLFCVLHNYTSQTAVRPSSCTIGRFFDIICIASRFRESCASIEEFNNF